MFKSHVKKQLMLFVSLFACHLNMYFYLFVFRKISFILKPHFTGSTAITGVSMSGLSNAQY